jgi:hypothetical protein
MVYIYLNQLHTHLTDFGVWSNSLSLSLPTKCLVMLQKINQLLILTKSDISSGYRLGNLGVRV